MKVVGEYISMIGKGLKNPGQVLNGWGNRILELTGHLDTDKKLIAEMRIDICRECPFSSVNAKSIGYNSDRKDEHCSLCGCPFSGKTRCMECSCTLKDYSEHKLVKKYNEKNPNHSLTFNSRLSIFAQYR